MTDGQHDLAGAGIGVDGARLKRFLLFLTAGPASSPTATDAAGSPALRKGADVTYGAWDQVGYDKKPRDTWPGAVTSNVHRRAGFRHWR